MTPALWDALRMYALWLVLVCAARQPPNVCVYSYSTNTTVGRGRARVLDAHMRSLGLAHTALVSAPPASARWPVSCLRKRGYIGMWTSMRRAWQAARRTCAADWVLLLESDALLPAHFARHAAAALRAPRQVVWFDARTGTGAGASDCCTNAVAYHRSTLDALLHHFDPTATDAYWVGYAARRKRVMDDPTCLTDWYLGNLVAHLGWNGYRRGVVPHSRHTRSEIATVA